MNVPNHNASPPYIGLHSVAQEAIIVLSEYQLLYPGLSHSSTVKDARLSQTKRSKEGAIFFFFLGLYFPERL